MLSPAITSVLATQFHKRPRHINPENWRLRGSFAVNQAEALHNTLFWLVEPVTQPQFEQGLSYRAMSVDPLMSHGLVHCPAYSVT